jgi:hypothetical protein
MRVSTCWATVRKPRAYLHQAAKNEAAALARRQGRHLDMAHRAANHVERSAENVYHQRDIGIVRDSLIILPSAQREVMARAAQVTEPATSPRRSAPRFQPSGQTCDTDAKRSVPSLTVADPRYTPESGYTRSTSAGTHCQPLCDR